MFKNGILFGIGGTAYILIEMLWRGHSHWSMFVLGGICFVLIGLINEKRNFSLISQAAVGSVCITLLEFLTGYILNIKLRLNVWNYYDMPMNIMGQVCLPYMVLWFCLSFVCVIADDILRCHLFGEDKVKHKLL